jgi:glutaredoxin
MGPGTQPGSGELVSPPFAVRGELEGLLLVWFDEQGTHSAARRSEIPEARRSTVRIDSLAVPPEQRLDPEHVYVADLTREAGAGYPVRKRPRAWFEAQVQALRPSPAQTASADVTIYMASWCGACRSAAAFLRSRDVAFVEKDVEKDPTANDEMLRKARAAGKTPRGVPVIDFRGNILLGFDRGALERLIDS